MRDSVPLGGLLTSTAAIGLFSMNPWLMGNFMSFAKSSVSYYAFLEAWTKWYDPVFNLPIGWITLITFLVVALITVSVGARRCMHFFASAPEPEGEVAFTIGSDGRRIDILPSTPWPQRCLGWLIFQIGMGFLLTSTYQDSCSLALTLLVLCKDAILRAVSHGLDRVTGNQVEPGSLRRLISASAYEQEGKQRTEVALANLRRYVNSHKGVMETVRNDTELRLRRFSDGRGHYQPETYNQSELVEGGCSIL